MMKWFSTTTLNREPELLKIERIDSHQLAATQHLHHPYASKTLKPTSKRSKNPAEPPGQILNPRAFCSLQRNRFSKGENATKTKRKERGRIRRELAKLERFEREHQVRARPDQTFSSSDEDEEGGARSDGERAGVSQPRTGDYRFKSGAKSLDHLQYYGISNEEKEQLYETVEDRPVQAITTDGNIGRICA